MTTFENRYNALIEDICKRHLKRQDKTRSLYKNASPYPHIVLDNFLELSVAQQIFNDFPSAEEEFWFRHTDVIEGRQRTEKLACNNLASSPESMGEVWLRQVADAMIESHFNGLELAKTV